MVAISNVSAPLSVPGGICWCLVLAACCSLLLYINHVATCDGLWLVAGSLLDLSLADICGLTLDILSVHFFFALFAACLCAIWVSASGRCLFSCRLIRTNRKYENSSLGRTCIQCKPNSTSHELCAVALAGIYRFSHADQGPTGKINDKLQEMILQHRVPGKVLRHIYGQIARNLL